MYAIFNIVYQLMNCYMYYSGSVGGISLCTVTEKGNFMSILHFPISTIYHLPTVAKKGHSKVDLWIKLDISKPAIAELGISKIDIS